MQVVEDIKDFPELAVAQAKKAQFYGGIAGLAVGGLVGGI